MKKSRWLVLVLLIGAGGGLLHLRSRQRSSPPPSAAAAIAPDVALAVGAIALGVNTAATTTEPVAAASGEVTPAAEPAHRNTEHRALSASDREQHLGRTARLLGQSIPWLHARQEAAERAGRQDEARALALREARLTARLGLVARGIDPDALLIEPAQGGSAN